MVREALVAFTAVVAVAVLPPGTTAARTPLGPVAVSDELQHTAWAYAASEAPIRHHPFTSSSRVATLRLTTESGFGSSYIVLARYRDTTGRNWLQVRVPGRPNGRKGWVSREAMGPFHVTRTSIEVDRATRRLVVRRAGRVIMRARVGVGKPGTPTPPGRFWIRERYRSLQGGGIYGARALGTSAYAPYLTDWPRGGVVGIHGTNQPELIPGTPSHGCIRLRDPDVIRLFRLAGVGTPLRIR